MRLIAIKNASMLAAALGALLSVAACSTSAPSHQSVSATTSATPPRYDPYVDEAQIVIDYSKTDPGIFEKFNNYPNKSTGETRRFFDSSGQPDMYVIDHNMETFDEAKYALLPNDFYQREFDQKYAAHKSSVEATYPPR